MFSSAVAVRPYRAALFLGGTALFAYVVRAVGPDAVAGAFATLSWRLGIVLIFPFTILFTLDTLGWRFAFPRERVPLVTLARIRLVGQAVSAVTPTATLGGEAVKVWLLRGDASTRESLVSVVIGKTSMIASQGLFLLLGVLLSRRIHSVRGPVVYGMEWLLALETLAVAGFIGVQLAGVLHGGHRLLNRIGMSGAHGGVVAEDVDRMLANFYRHQPRQFALSIGCNFLGWLASAGEVWVILHLIGAPVSMTIALVIEAFATAIRFAAFLVPAHIGVMEGGVVMTFLALGLSAANGLSFALVRRVRELAWTGIGLLLLAGRPLPSPRALLDSRS
jgi:uncharacterized membrane protein YbhN (UPF0104 family)